MKYDLGDSFPFDFEPNGIPFASNRKKNCHHNHIPFNVKGNRNIVSSVYGDFVEPVEKNGNDNEGVRKNDLVESWLSV